MPDITKIERAISRLNVANLALMTLVEAEPGNKDLDDIHLLMQEVNQELKDVIEENQNAVE